MAQILNFCLALVTKLSDAGILLLDFLGTEFTVPGYGSYTIFDMVFGIGLSIYLTYVIFKFLIPTS